jgi:hypothetical protein
MRWKLQNIPYTRAEDVLDAMKLGGAPEGAYEKHIDELSDQSESLAKHYAVHAYNAWGSQNEEINNEVDQYVKQAKLLSKSRYNSDVINPRFWIAQQNILAARTAIK